MKNPVGYTIAQSTTSVGIKAGKAIARGTVKTGQGLAKFGRDLMAGYRAARDEAKGAEVIVLRDVS